MQIGSLSGANSMWDLAAIQKITDDDTRYSNIASQTTPSGDRVDISDQARELYAKMIHKYDKTAVTGNTATTETSEQGSGGAPAGGGGGGSDEDTITKIKEQIQSLKSQIMALASQAQQQGPGSAAASQMSALEAQVASLEAQLNEMAA